MRCSTELARAPPGRPASDRLALKEAAGPLVTWEDVARALALGGAAMALDGEFGVRGRPLLASGAFELTGTRP